MRISTPAASTVAERLPKCIPTVPEILLETSSTGDITTVFEATDCSGSNGMPCVFVMIAMIFKLLNCSSGQKGDVYQLCRGCESIATMGWVAEKLEIQFIARGTP